jgi:hypothetical protein
MSDPSAKKVLINVQIEGTESTQYIHCDIDESKGYPVAMLFWPSSVDTRVAFHRLASKDLVATSDAGLSYIHTGDPIPLPKVLAEMRPDPLSDDAFRRGFFFVQKGK